MKYPMEHLRFGTLGAKQPYAEFHTSRRSHLPSPFLQPYLSPTQTRQPRNHSRHITCIQYLTVVDDDMHWDWERPVPQGTLIAPLPTRGRNRDMVGPNEMLGYQLGRYHLGWGNISELLYSPVQSKFLRDLRGIACHYHRSTFHIGLHVSLHRRCTVASPPRSAQQEYQ
jgi:hypothetical protein